MIDTSKWLTPKEVMRNFRVTDRDTVTKNCRDGTWRVLNLGTPDHPLYRIDPDSVAEWQLTRITGGKKKESLSDLPPGVERYV
jgi:hypothetical protein